MPSINKTDENIKEIFIVLRALKRERKFTSMSEIRESELSQSRKTLLPCNNLKGHVVLDLEPLYLIASQPFGYDQV